MLNNHQRTTITLHPAVFERAKRMSREQGKTMSELIETSLRGLLHQWEANRLKRTYTALKALDGAGEKGITDASTTIDELLYGLNGAWKGQHDE